ncbi:hypothetical protein B0H13DRAFT_2117596 [Mycena leptocephala]|nr:hypothetical protein B0H13DRAFT_2117596 [Mycena leptocephala]
MTVPDWSKTDVKSHKDSPWLRIPPTEQALRDFRPHVLFRPSPVRDAAVFAAEVKGRTFFGHPKGIKPQKPTWDDYIYDDSEMSQAPRPVEPILKPPPLQLGDPPPPDNFLYPKAGIFTLKKTSAYQRGYVYAAPYYREKLLKEDHYRMLRVVPPPQLSPSLDGKQYIHHPVPECVQMVPGVPFVFELEGDPNEHHTIGAVHTLESLRHEPDFDEILDDTILVAKGLRGCRRVGDVDEVFPITHWPIRTNDRSPSDVPNGSKAGSYNLASTLFKGNGPGVVLPAAQVDTPEFTGQVSIVLQCLSRLRRRLLRKTLSKYEYDSTEFNSDDMNVIGFGGLKPNNATSTQLNLSPIWDILAKALGLQGSPHPDVRDDETRRTYFLLLLSLPPNSDAGAFLLARAGLYVRELDAWAIHIFFDGTDIHTGIGATTTLSKSEFQQWVEGDLETAWKQSELGRMGVVQYAMRSAHNRDTYLSMTPSVRFGNFGPEQPVKVRDFATHGQEILGGQEAWANRMGREIIYDFWNKLQHCNLDLGTDIGDLLKSISFKNDEGRSINLQQLPFHPIHNAEEVASKRAQFEYLRLRCASMRIYIEKHQFLDFRQRLRRKGYDPAKDPDTLYVQWESRISMAAKLDSDSGLSTALTDFNGEVTGILGAVRIDGKLHYKVQTNDDDPTPRFVEQSDDRLTMDMVNEFIAAEMRKVQCGSILDIQISQPLASTEDVEMADREPIALEPDLEGRASSSESGSQLIEKTTESLEHPTAPRSPDPQPATTSGASETAPPSQSNDESSPDEQDDVVYDVEKIINVRNTRKGKQYLCKFVGFEEPDWADEEDLSLECDSLLQDFYESLAPAVNGDADSAEDSSDSSDSEQPKRKRRKLEKPKPDGQIAHISLNKTGDLEALLNLTRLDSEVAKVKEARPTHGTGSRMFFEALGSQNLVRNLNATAADHVRRAHS